MTILTGLSLATGYRFITTWDDDRIAADFTDPSTGHRYVFVITRSLRAESDAGAERTRTLIRARGHAYRLLAEAHGAEYEALLADVLAELGPVTADARRAS